ncbi:MAG: hypothetical protein AAF726_08860 [Planctomycetota bacterium]
MPTAVLALALFLAGPLCAQDSPPAVSDDDRVHTAVDGRLRASALWRSERGDDLWARAALAIAGAVDAAVTGAGFAVPEGAAESPGEIELLLAESPNALRKAMLLAPAGFELLGKMRPLAVEAFGVGPTPAVAVAPRIHDRSMFVTGLPPATYRTLALAAANRLVAPASADDEAVRAGRCGIAAHEALMAVDRALPIDQEPFTSAGLVELRRSMGSSRVRGGTRAEGLLRALGEGGFVGFSRTGLEPWAADRPFAASAGDMAAYLIAKVEGPDAAEAGTRVVRAVEMFDELQPRWIVESGAVASHPYGWHAVGPGKNDALILSAESRRDEPFVLRTTFIAVANDQESSAQADFVFGDVDGARVHVALTSGFGLYLYHRAGPDAPYVALADRKKRRILKGQETPVRIEYDGEALRIFVGDLEPFGVRMSGMSLEGRWGFGAHGGSSVLFRDLVLE